MYPANEASQPEFLVLLRVAVHQLKDGQEVLARSHSGGWLTGQWDPGVGVVDRETFVWMAVEAIAAAWALPIMGEEE